MTEGNLQKLVGNLVYDNFIVYIKYGYNRRARKNGTDNFSSSVFLREHKKRLEIYFIRMSEYSSK